MLRTPLIHYAPLPPPFAESHARHSVIYATTPRHVVSFLIVAAADIFFADTNDASLRAELFFACRLLR